jgi:hypothetical protein
MAQMEPLGRLDPLVQKDLAVRVGCKECKAWMAHRVLRASPDHKARWDSTAATEPEGHKVLLDPKAHGVLKVRADSTEVMEPEGQPVPLVLKVRSVPLGHGASQDPTYPMSTARGPSATRAGVGPMAILSTCMSPETSR